MTKILVTTDFSDNSIAAIRFAIQLSKQYPVSITFFHSYHILRPTSLSESQFDAYEKEETSRIGNQLQNFISNITKNDEINNNQFEYVIKESIVPDSNILNYSENHAFDYICMGTRGAGAIEKIFGTNTSNVINKSTIPVIAVPKNYINKPITDLLYASDLTALETEINKVVAFAKPLKARIDLLNFSFPSEVIENTEFAQQKTKNITDYPIALHFQENDFLKTLADNIKIAVSNFNPSLLVMFNNPQKSILQKILFRSNSETIAFNTETPLLIFKKY